MEIVNFEIVDLGVGPEGSFDHWGPGFNPDMNASAMGVGDTARKALDDALDQLALDGYGTRLLHESALEAGFMGSMADAPADSIPAHSDEDEDEDDDTPLQYHIGIRFHVEDVVEEQQH